MTREELRVLIRDVIGEATADMRTELAAVVGQTAAPKDSMTVSKGLLTERQIQSAASKNLDAVHVTKSVLVTPLARDAARSKGVRIERID
jgi:hypothetical protein